jgi:hypothetical protein
MFAEYVDRSGEILARAEGEITTEAELANLVGSLSDRFRTLYPERSFQADIGKARCIIRIGAVDAPPATRQQGAFAT